MTRIIFLRHGETFDNTNNQIIESSETTLLTDLGITQAKISGQFLKKHYNIKTIVSSPLERTRMTSEIVAKQLKYPAKKIQYNDDAKEFDYGTMKGLTKDEILELDNGKNIMKILNELNRMDIVEYTKEAEYFKLKNKLDSQRKSENYEKLIKRVKKFMKYIATIKSSGDILIVSHNEFINYVIHVMKNISLYGIGNNFGRYSNCHITVFDKKTKKMELTRYSFHLDSVY